MSNAPSGDALLRRIENCERLLGLTGSGAGGLSYPQQGSRQSQVFPPVSSFYASQLSVSGTTPQTVANSPTVVATIGPSGDAVIEVGANISGSAAGAGGLIYAYVDGVNLNVLGDAWVVNYQGQSNVSLGTKFRVVQLYGTTLTPGSHTFTLQYACAQAGGDSSIFLLNYLIVTPI